MEHSHNDDRGEAGPGPARSAGEAFPAADVDRGALGADQEFETSEPYRQPRDSDWAHQARGYVRPLDVETRKAEAERSGNEVDATDTQVSVDSGEVQPPN